MYSDDDLEEENAPIVNKVSPSYTPNIPSYHYIFTSVYALHLTNPTIHYTTSFKMATPVSRTLTYEGARGNNQRADEDSDDSGERRPIPKR